MSWYFYVIVVIIVEDQGCFLLVEEQVDGCEVLNQFVGYLEFVESLFEVVLCEIFEEIGWEVELSVVIGIYLYIVLFNGVIYQCVCFVVCFVCYYFECVFDDGIIGLCWLICDELVVQLQCWCSYLVLCCIDDYLVGGCYFLVLICDIYVLFFLFQV